MDIPTPTPDPANVVADALTDFFMQLYTFVFETILGRFFRNLYNSFADISVSRWTKVILSVVGYVIARPYIERLFKHMHEKDRKKHQEKERAAAAARAGEGKAKVSANALRGGTESGKVLGEVENTDDELSDGEVDFATASGVPEMGKNARKRQKKYMKSLEKEAAERMNQLSEEQVLELLDWSESEDEGEKKKAAAGGDKKE